MIFRKKEKVIKPFYAGQMVVNNTNNIIMIVNTDAYQVEGKGWRMLIDDFNWHGCDKYMTQYCQEVSCYDYHLVGDQK